MNGLGAVGCVWLGGLIGVLTYKVQSISFQAQQNWFLRVNNNTITKAGVLLAAIYHVRLCRDCPLGLGYRANRPREWRSLIFAWRKEHNKET
jgi:hypothetical protein